MKERIKVTAVWWQEYDVDNGDTDYDYDDELSEAAIDYVINDPESFDKAEWSVDGFDGI